MNGLFWFLRGALCRRGWMSCKPVATDPSWVAEFGPRICAYCWEPKP